MVAIILAIATILMGAKAFTPGGIPLTRTKNLTGTTAKIVGIICILLGALFIVDSVFGAARLLSLLSGSRQ